MTPGKRLKLLRKKLGLTQEQLGAKLGLTWYQVRDIESGKVELTTPLSKLLHYAVGANEQWLLEEKGEMIAEEPARYEPTVPFRRAEDEDPLLAALIAQLKTIKTHGSPVQFGQVRGIIETIYDELKKQGREPEPKTALSKEGEAGKKTP
jgi:transcriptional regulator with XRE-family HTH domain